MVCASDMVPSVTIAFAAGYECLCVTRDTLKSLKHVRISIFSPRPRLTSYTGARIREYYLARALASRAEVTYASFIQPGFPEPTAAELSFFHQVHLVHLRGRYSASRIARGLVDRRPLSVLNYTTPEMKAVVAALGQEREYDGARGFHCDMAEYAKLLETLWKHPVRAGLRLAQYRVRNTYAVPVCGDDRLYGEEGLRQDHRPAPQNSRRLDSPHRFRACGVQRERAGAVVDSGSVGAPQRDWKWGGYGALCRACRESR